MSQGLSEREKIENFCMIFKNKNLRDHTQILSENLSISTLSELVNYVIDQTGLDESSIIDIQAKFSTFKIYQPLDECFLKLFEYRKLGFGGESESIILTITKQKFISLLNPNNKLEGMIYSFSFNEAWSRLNTHWSVASELRKIVLQFQRSPSNIVEKNSVGKTQAIAMEVDNKMMGKKCVDCGKFFNPAQDFHKSCNQCFRSKRSKSSKNKRGHKNFKVHNMESNNVGIGLENYHLITINFKSNDLNEVFSCSDGLFDTGSGPTCVLYKVLEDYRLTDTIRPLSDDSTIKQGDGSIMTGCLGTVDLTISLVDTFKNSTKFIKQNFFVFKNLNHKFIIGRDCMNLGTRCYVVYPKINAILFNPTLKSVKTMNRREIQNCQNLNINGPPPKIINSTKNSSIFNQNLNNHISKSSEHPQSFPPESNMTSLSPPKPNFNSSNVVNHHINSPPIKFESTESINFDESSNIILNLPQLSVNQVKFEKNVQFRFVGKFDV